MAVHPRVGGERVATLRQNGVPDGSSPRGRGTRGRLGNRGRRRRFIPAWAGNAPWAGRVWMNPPVHPRVGGERQLLPRPYALLLGSSPRGRGTPQDGFLAVPWCRFIPAWAGNAIRHNGFYAGAAVHPRVGGERIHQFGAGPTSTGSSPRGRGTPCGPRVWEEVGRFIPAWAGNAWCRTQRTRRRPVHPRVGGERQSTGKIRLTAAGSSPRGRGTRRPTARHSATRRFIPAWAGNARQVSARTGRETVHPRVGGERPAVEVVARQLGGSSPRGRGTPGAEIVTRDRQRFIPAWAGNALCTPRPRTPCPVHPRVGGERPFRLCRLNRQSGSSPRGRGTPTSRPRPPPRPRFIPAWAGNASGALCAFGDKTVHPRVGGERAAVAARNPRGAGSSPRGRGTQTRPPVRLPTRRFIPAWAGNATGVGACAPGSTVHPRVGGERAELRQRDFPETGSSPRGRGTPASPASSGTWRRFIPAWAGNAGAASPGCSAATVHPRVGGERVVPISTVATSVGSSPRGRGTRVPVLFRSTSRWFIPAWAGNARAGIHRLHGHAVHPRVGGERVREGNRPSPNNGSSPRGRGTRRRGPKGPARSRFIPAWAGNAHPNETTERSQTVHPRVGGERSAGRRAAFLASGSSPRGRGTRCRRYNDSIWQRFIPAWAGNAGRGTAQGLRTAVHPRVGGERAQACLDAVACLGSSPRGRGTRRSSNASTTGSRFIPAWAGNALRPVAAWAVHAVHPRVGGERQLALNGVPSNVGSSPRGRGTLVMSENSVTDSRFIPAWAGNACAVRPAGPV